jgi:PAS domain S-box-containing protein
LGVIVRDVKSSKQAEEALRRSEARLSGILAIAADAIISIDEQQLITLFNDGAEQIFGYSRAEALGQPLDFLLPERFRVAHRDHVGGFARSPTAARKMGERQEIFGRRKNGEEFAAEASISKLAVDSETTFTVVLRDVTERKRAEAALARINEELEARVAARTRELEAEIRRREQAQAKLIKTQRMEAFGQLTGGVAHDFNNLLTIVTGNLELLEPELTTDNARALLRRAMDAAEMGARLTSRLLTFARRRQLEPVQLNLNEQVVDMTELLRRTLGENIALTTHLDSGLWAIRADPSEIENAVLNLAINARDAMPYGGQLTIETKNVTFNEMAAHEGLAPGAYVRLSVSDTGTGMPPDILRRAFEPFFTTKEGGRGTGLGLSTIYGFAQQSGGNATIYSEVGHGTTVNVYLPRAEGVAKDLFASPSEAVALSENGEVVLVVEDNPEVREVTLQRVEGLGYVVEEADSAPSAIRTLESGKKFDLVFSDIVMPGGQSGYDLARWVRTNRPEIKVLLTSGFAAHVVGGGSEGASEFKVLRKPYNRAELSRALKEVLQT